MHMAATIGDVTGLQKQRHPQNIPHLVKKIKGFPLKVKSFQITATYEKSGEGFHPRHPPLYHSRGMNLRVHPRDKIPIVSRTFPNYIRQFPQCSGYHVRLTRGRSPVQFWPETRTLSFFFLFFFSFTLLIITLSYITSFCRKRHIRERFSCRKFANHIKLTKPTLL